MNLKEKRLKNSKVFCMMPWIHLHAWPTGKVYPCCLSDPKTVFGNTHQQSLKEIINSEDFKNLRKNMLADEASESCKRCYELEESADVYTLRKNSIASFGHLYEKSLAKTKEDGRLEDFKMAYMDLRFSNVCNFKCRTCGPEFSSSWQEEVSATKKIIPFSLLENPNFWAELESLLLDVEEVYFAGGEALVSPEHYKILKHWIVNNKTDVRLRYTTNFSHFKYKSDDLLDLWKNFKDVRVAASLDADGMRAEYLRKGTNWAQIEKNRIEMIDRCPHIYFEITPTVSLYNCFNLPDFHKNWIERKLVSPDKIRINYLLDPVYMRSQVLPKELKHKLEIKYFEHIKFLEKIEANEKINLREVKKQFQDVVKFIFQEDKENQAEQFFKHNKDLDNKREESFLKIFPELAQMIENFHESGPKR